MKQASKTAPKAVFLYHARNKIAKTEGLTQKIKFLKQERKEHLINIFYICTEL